MKKQVNDFLFHIFKLSQKITIISKTIFISKYSKYFPTSSVLLNIEKTLVIQYLKYISHWSISIFIIETYFGDMYKNKTHTCAETRKKRKLKSSVKKMQKNIVLFLKRM